MNISEKTRKIILVVAVIVLIAGLLVTAYPYIASAYSEHLHSEVRTQYEEVVNNSNNEQLSQIRAQAEEWNQKLFSGQISPLETDTNGYYDTLQLPNTSIMGTIRIPCINVELPIYHSIADEILAKGVGHMPQSSLPIGGINTHTVLSAHSGMASSPMFSNLELMEVGDIFYIDILGETLTYQVYEIEPMVEPENVRAVQIQRGRDLCTLVTCTPYGINTHRLLVHGERIETVEEPEETIPTTSTGDTMDEKSVWSQNYLQSIFHGFILAVILILAAILIFGILYRRKCKRASTNTTVEEVPESDGEEKEK